MKDQKREKDREKKQIIEYIQYIEKVLLFSNNQESAIYRIIYTSVKLNMISKHIE